ncbi:16S rRNA (uracil(1498)-N(3))-methyltransferase [Pseudotenacibaculum sp. MALMAid0570]|uniref:16S rRNA (uracil(1498)-N(3))-methyltransferase n=1 Tax=Pseudotenacibaculum sp. MALMAid0570 TaxID=3143938 RepID=UPI0032DF6086
MQLFYNQHINQSTEQITFDKVESRHIVKVLRKKEGDRITISNGKGWLFTSEIILASDKKCIANIIAKEEKAKQRDYYLHIAIAPTKNNERLEWFLEKATEIGIDEITPIICQNSERKVIKAERLEKIILSAAKQSLKYHLPKLNAVSTFNDFLQTNSKENIYIAHCYDGEKELMKNIVKSKQNITILIGPEGDFSLEEVSKSVAASYIPISLGEARLRTETAALVSVQNVAFINQ